MGRWVNPFGVWKEGGVAVAMLRSPSREHAFSENRSSLRTGVLLTKALRLDIVNIHGNAFVAVPNMRGVIASTDAGLDFRVILSLYNRN
jgi:hypothetical protein